MRAVVLQVALSYSNANFPHEFLSISSFWSLADEDEEESSTLANVATIGSLSRGAASSDSTNSE